MKETTAAALAEGLLQAMRAEHEGHHFYSLAASNTTDPKGREVFQRLAAEELEHFEFLRSQHRSVLETGRPDANLKLGARSDVSGTSPIFSESLRSRIATAHYEMVALSVGAQLELNAVRFYSEAAAGATDPAVRLFFGELAAWEQGHYDALTAQAEALKEDYWAGAGFAPF
jgi:rubrerythrin